MALPGRRNSLRCKGIKGKNPKSLLTHWLDRRFSNLQLCLSLSLPSAAHSPTFAFQQVQLTVNCFLTFLRTNGTSSSSLSSSSSCLPHPLHLHLLHNSHPPSRHPRLIISASKHPLRLLRYNFEYGIGLFESVLVVSWLDSLSSVWASWLLYTI